MIERLLNAKIPTSITLHFDGTGKWDGVKLEMNKLGDKASRFFLEKIN